MPSAPPDFNLLRAFVGVAEAGGFTAAAERLGVGKSRLSLDVARLEAALGTALLTRTTRRVTLTEAGQALYARSAGLLRELQDALDGASAGVGAALQGTLRISATVDHVAQSLAPLIVRFAAAHPALQIDLRTSDRVTDLVGEGIDVAIRLGWLRDSSLHATRLGEFEQYVVAAPGYLARAGTPTEPQALAQHAWVALTLLRAPLAWRFTRADAPGVAQTVRLQARLRCDATSAVHALVDSGAGISVLDALSAAEGLRSGRLVRLLPEWQLERGGIYAVYAPGVQVAPKVRAFVDFCAQTLSA